MSRRSAWSWLVLVVWSAWIYAVTGRAAAAPGLAGFVPDLGLVLVLGLEPRLSAPDATRVAALVGLARAAFSADPLPGVLAGFLAAVWISGAVRAFVDVEGALGRAALAGAAALIANAVLVLAHAGRVAARAPDAGGALAAIGAAPVLSASAATAVAAAFLAPVLVRLPGLSPFHTRARRAFA